MDDSLMVRFLVLCFNALGHGRALEFTLGYLKIWIGIAVATSHLSTRIPALSDFAWEFPVADISIPFFLVGSMQLTGVLTNINGYKCSWILRAIASVLAMALWSILLIKSGLLGQPTLVIPLAATCIPASIFLFYKAWLGLPLPGAPGLR